MVVNDLAAALEEPAEVSLVCVDVAESQLQLDAKLKSMGEIRIAELGPLVGAIARGILEVRAGKSRHLHLQREHRCRNEERLRSPISGSCEGNEVRAARKS